MQRIQAGNTLLFTPILHYPGDVKTSAEEQLICRRLERDARIFSSTNTEAWWRGPIIDQDPSGPVRDQDPSEILWTDLQRSIHPAHADVDEKLSIPSRM